MPNWISVNERLPEMELDDYGWPMSRPVLTYNTFGRQQVGYIQQVEEDYLIEWKSDCSECWTITEHITHWQPLPEPPNGE